MREREREREREVAYLSVFEMVCSSVNGPQPMIRHPR